MRLGKRELVLSNEQNVGQRERQEDYFGFLIDEDQAGEANNALVVLADGMGGLDGGDAASVVAVNAFIDSMRHSDPSVSIAERFEIAAQEANAKVYEIANATGRDIGSTLVALYLTPDTYQWISIGDSILYRLREGRLERLNRDHNLGTQLSEQLSEGLISEEEAAERNAEREHLTSNLGLEEIPEIDLTEPEPLQVGDRFVLASDGLSNTVPLWRIEKKILSSQPDEIAPELVQEALEEQNPKQDNISVASVTIDHMRSTSRKVWLWGLALLILVLAVFLTLMATGALNKTQKAKPSSATTSSKAATTASPNDKHHSRTAPSDREPNDSVRVGETNETKR